jgi:hypothetical protein
MSERKAAPFRILVIANESVDGRELREIVQAHSARAATAEVLVVAPALSSRIRFWVSDIDPARRRAERRLHESLPGLGGDGIAVKSSIGDSEPLQAIADWLRIFAANEVILVTHTEDEAHWVEHDLVERARALFPDIPIVHLVAGRRRLHSSTAVSQV